MKIFNIFTKKEKERRAQKIRMTTEIENRFLERFGENYVGQIESKMDGRAKIILDRAVDCGLPHKLISRVFGISLSTLKDIHYGRTRIPSAVVMECLIQLSDFLDEEEAL